MSLKEAYTLAHTAQCRLNLAATRPDRNLRFVVGHLMTYEALRLRIVEIEHDVSKSQRAQAVQFKGTGHVDHRLQHKPSTGSFRGRSPPPSAMDGVDGSDGDVDLSDGTDEDVDDLLSLTRFPSGAAAPSQPPPDLEPDDVDADDDYDDEPVSPDELDQVMLEQAVKGEGNETLATIYEGVRKCSCHGATDAPVFERMWELPGGQENGKGGRTRMVAQVAVQKAY